MQYLFLFFIELLFLFLLSRVLTKSLYFLFYRITKSQTTTIRLLAFLFLPGVVIHELSHALTAGILFVRVGEMEFMPLVKENEVKLGSVQIERTDFLRSAFIALSPIMVGGSILLLSLLYAFSYVELPFVLPVVWRWVAALYIVFEIGNTMFSSRKDIEGVFGLLTVAGFLVIGLLFASFYTHTNQFAVVIAFFSNLISPSVTQLFQRIDTLLFVPLLLDLGICGVTRL